MYHSHQDQKQGRLQPVRTLYTNEIIQQGGLEDSLRQIGPRTRVMFSNRLLRTPIDLQLKLNANR